MVKLTLQSNTLQLSNLFGSSKNYPEWFYNGSIKFEKTNTGSNVDGTLPEDRPRVFTSLTEAVEFFTINTTEKERAIGQVVTWAYGTYDNWLTYTFIGSDLTDEEYSNVDNWKLFGNPNSEINTSIDETLDSSEALDSELVSENQLQETILI